MSQKEFRNYQENRFGLFCKTTIWNARTDNLRARKNREKRFSSLDALQLDVLELEQTEDTYVTYERVYRVKGIEVIVRDERIGEAVALGATVVETAEGVEIYATDELGTTNVTVRHGKDGADGATPVKGVDYFTPAEAEEIAGKAAGMVPGGSDKWEYIGEFSVDADVESWIISEDADGAPIRLRRMYFDAVFQPAAGATDNATLSISNPVYPSLWGANQVYSNIAAGVRASRTTLKMWADYIPTGNGFAIRACHSPSAANLAWGQGISPRNELDKCIGGLALKTADASKARIGAGSTVKIWGVRM